MKPLFIPLKAEFYEAFVSGAKDTEYRIYGHRWNERTCPIGRDVVISKGYGKQARRKGKIVGFNASHEPTLTEAWQACYGNDSATRRRVSGSNWMRFNVAGGAWASPGTSDIRRRTATQSELRSALIG